MQQWRTSRHVTWLILHTFSSSHTVLYHQLAKTVESHSNWQCKSRVAASASQTSPQGWCAFRGSLPLTRLFPLWQDPATHSDTACGKTVRAMHTPNPTHALYTAHADLRCRISSHGLFENMIKERCNVVLCQCRWRLENIRHVNTDSLTWELKANIYQQLNNEAISVEQCTVRCFTLCNHLTQPALMRTHESTVWGRAKSAPASLLQTWGLMQCCQCVHKV